MARLKTNRQSRSRRVLGDPKHQFCLPLETPKRAIFTPRPKKSEKTYPRFFSVAVMVLNCVLLLILAFLLVKEVFYSPPQHTVVITTEPVIEKSSIRPAPVLPEDEFLQTALNQDEMYDNNMFVIESELQKPIALPVVVDDKMTSSVRADDWELSDEEIYSLYEEKGIVADNKTAAALKFENKGNPKIAIVIDDMGVSPKRTKDIAELAFPLTVSFLTYAQNLPSQIANSQASGQEIMAHLPMEPQVMQNYTSTMLLVKMSDEEILKNLKIMLDAIPQAKAVNNHMGSRFTEDKHRMDVVMDELAARGLNFLDSQTTPRSQGMNSAREHHVKTAMRDVFLDNLDDFDYITNQLHKVETIAREKGYAIAIGHPKAQTYAALKAWLPGIKEKGLELVPMSNLFASLPQQQ
ncbi:MAG: divergent polysaccharide deacetylase family protein [Alphaproteobacteria bacterium]|nr:divergent polysaccharide deacetylase family protein [Alphaproteobacteria bacterium]